MTTYGMMVLVLVMLLAGSVGGLANYLTADKSDPQASDLARSWLLGVVAALMVPLFLKVISSDLISNISKITLDSPMPFDLFVFAGMCLLAAVSSKRFIQTLSDRVLQAAKEAKQQAQQATEMVAHIEEKVEPMVVQQTEPEPSAEVASAAPDASTLDEENKRVLLAFSKRSFALRTRSGLVMDAAIDTSKIDEILRHLVAMGLVGTRTLDNNKQRWFITEAGQQMAASIAPPAEPSGPRASGSLGPSK